MSEVRLTEITSDQIATFERFAKMAFEWAQREGLRPGDMLGALAWAFARLKHDRSIPSLDDFNAENFVELSRVYQRILSGVEPNPDDTTPFKPQTN